MAGKGEGRTRATTKVVAWFRDVLPSSFLPCSSLSAFSSVERERNAPTSLRMRGGAPVGGWPWLGAMDGDR